MKILIGAIIVTLSVLVGYIGGGGHLEVLWRPFEILIIIGAAVGAFIISNPKEVLAEVPHILKKITTKPYGKAEYIEQLSLLYTIFKIIKGKGIISIEVHLDNPTESGIFKNFKVFLKNKIALQYICDYLRMMTMGSNNAFQMESIMEDEIQVIKAQHKQLSSAFFTMADGMPALGIVAAVLGVIHTMGSITQPPETLGKLIGGALVGTFAGVLLSYGFVSPIGSAIQATNESEIRYIQCLKTGLLAFLNGYAPLLAVEYARKRIDSSVRPTFLELETAISKISD